MIEIKRKDGTVIRTIDADTLSWANLSEANLSGAKLSWANLREANLSGAKLSWAKISADQMPDIIKALGMEVTS